MHSVMMALFVVCIYSSIPINHMYYNMFSIMHMYVMHVIYSFVNSFNII